VKDVRHIILISIDTCRADYLSCYGYPLRTTPNIDRFAQENILFTNAVSPVPVTLPAHCTMLTGVIPPYHGVHYNIGCKLGPASVTLPEILGSKGFSTAAFISSLVLDSKFGLSQGFNTYNGDFNNMRHGLYSNERRAEQTNSLAFKWLEKNRDKKFFLFLHYYDPHYEYKPPEPFASRFADNLYAGEIAYVDYCLGRLINKLKELGLYQSALMVITSDHGEMLGEHGEDTHMYFIYQSAIKVPLIFKLPGFNKPAKIDSLVGLIDIVPTICSFLGLNTPKEVDGQDLCPYFYGKGLSDMKRYLYSESLVPFSIGANSLRAVLTERWKYIQTTRPELYDLVKDEREMNNLIKQQPRQAHLLKEQLKRILLLRKRQNNQSRLDLDEKTLKQLESLGYVGTVNKEVEFDKSKEDPKDLIEFFNSGQVVRRLVFQKKFEEARALCEKLLSRRPDLKDLQLLMAEIHSYLGMAMAGQEKLDLAVDHFKKAIEINPEMLQTYSDLAWVFSKQKKFSEVSACYEKLLEIDPNQAVVLDRLGEAYYYQGQINRAFNCWEKALKFKPDWIEVLNILAWVKATHEDIRFRNPAQAVRLAQRACKLTNNRNPVMLNTLAAAYAAAGNFTDAVKTAERTLKLALAAGKNELVGNIRNHLELYKKGRAYYISIPSEVIQSPD
jgi:arylsulfatase A-like enzyme/Tfp pilus assembly protein PilF